MTILSAQSIRALKIVSPMEDRISENGLTYGVSACGYDLRIVLKGNRPHTVLWPKQFILAATVERFDMPDNVAGVVHDKSSLARRGLSVFNTVIEPGWRGWLTLELVNNSWKPIKLLSGQAIAQVLFHKLDNPTAEPYNGKYQDQEYGPQTARK